MMMLAVTAAIVMSGIDVVTSFYIWKLGGPELNPIITPDNMIAMKLLAIVAVTGLGILAEKITTRWIDKKARIAPVAPAIFAYFTFKPIWNNLQVLTGAI